MKLIKKAEGHSHDAPGHVGQFGITKLQAGKDTQRVNFLVSHFLPQGGLEMTPATRELIYYGMSGTLQVKGKNEEHTIEPGDLLYIAPGDERAIHVPGTEPATILVISIKGD